MALRWLCRKGKFPEYSSWIHESNERVLLKPLILRSKENRWQADGSWPSRNVWPILVVAGQQRPKSGSKPATDDVLQG